MENSSSHRTSNYLYTTRAPAMQPSQPSRQRKDSCLTQFVRRLIMSMILLFITLSTISLVAWFAFHPHVPVFRVDSLQVSNFNLSNHSHLSSNYELKLAITNPNQNLNVSFETIDISILYRKKSLSKSWIKSFELGKMKQTMVTAVLHTDSGFLLEKKIGNDMDVDLRKKFVCFEARITIGAKYKAKYWPSKERGMKVSCLNLIVEFNSAKKIGRFNGGKMDCFVNLV